MGVYENKSDRQAQRERERSKASFSLHAIIFSRFSFIQRRQINAHRILFCYSTHTRANSNKNTDIFLFLSFSLSRHKYVPKTMRSLNGHSQITVVVSFKHKLISRNDGRSVLDHDRHRSINAYKRSWQRIGRGKYVAKQRTDGSILLSFECDHVRR